MGTERLIEHLAVRAWDDPIRDQVSQPLGGPYLEFCWLGVIGPTSAWLLRRLALPLAAQPGGFEVDVADLARDLGLGRSISKAAAGLDRLVHFGLARMAGPAEVQVTTTLPPLRPHHLGRLSPWAVRYHHQVTAPRTERRAG